MQNGKPDGRRLKTECIDPDIIHMDQSTSKMDSQIDEQNSNANNNECISGASFHVVTFSIALNSCKYKNTKHMHIRHPKSII